MSGPVAVLPLCPVACGSVLARVGGELRAVVIVKATFALAHERSAWPVEAAPLVEVDEHIGGHPTSSLFAASELAVELPGAGVVVTAAAHAPGGRPTTHAAVRLAVFQGGAAAINKALQVTGDATRDAPSPAPFTRIPIVYERAFGGPSVPENPAGVGAGRSGAQPNVVDPRAPERPAGFGPIARTWAPRVKAMRAFDGAPRGEGDVVSLDASIDWEAFHAAPSDQRLEALQGDEWIVLDGLHATLPRVQTQLPFVRAEARFVRTDRPGALTPVPLRADTLVIDAERLLASVIWRGHVVVESVEAAKALRVYAGLELPSLPIRWPVAPAAAPPAAVSPEESWPEIPDTTSERDIRAIRAALLAGPPAPAAPADDDDEGDDLDQTAEIRRVHVRAALPFSKAAAASIAAERGEPVDRIPTDTVEAAPSSGVTLPFSSKVVPPAAAPLDPRAEVARLRASGGSFAGVALAGVDLTGIDLTEADLSSVDLSGANLSGGSLAGAKLVGAQLGGANLTGARLEGADLSRADLARATLTLARLAGARVDGATFAYARGDGASFVGVRGAGASFARGMWDQATFDDAELDGADFTGASLASARFVHARLADGRLVDARGAKASFEGARLDAVKASGAALPGASLKLVQAKGSAWDGADLAAASFEGAILEGASLFRASAPGARFAGADLRGANLQRLSAAGAELVGADLRGADLRQAKLGEAVLDEANLRDVVANLADFAGARLRSADLTGATLREATFVGADLAHARLDRADLRDADLADAVLTGASQQGTKLAGAKLPVRKG